MDWLMLFLLVPAILMPIVFLCGFAGCGEPLSISGEGIPIPGPMGLTASASGNGEIVLEWNGEPADTSTFKIFRAPQGGAIDPNNPLATIASTLGLKGFTDKDPLLGEVNTFVYRMEAFNSLGHKLAISNDATVTSLPLAPSEMKVEPKDASTIEVTWKNNSLKADRMVVSREPLPAGAQILTDVPSIPELFLSEFLAEGSRHKYQLAALFRGTLNGVPNQEVKSLFTPALTAFANTFKAAFSVALTTNQIGLHGSCIVTRFPALSTQSKTWTKLRITLRGSTAGPLTLDKVTISQPADQHPPDPLLPATARERWDSAAQGLGNESGIRVLRTGVGPDGTPAPAGTAVILPANTAKAFIEDYSWDESKDLIIAFDINITQGQGNVRHGPAMPAPPPESYLKARQSATVATAQAATQDRTSDFQPSQSHYLVELIEVA
jgi:hypothetical protein